MGIRPDRPDRVGETQPKPKHRAFLGQSRPEFLERDVGYGLVEGQDQLGRAS